MSSEAKIVNAVKHLASTQNPAQETSGLLTGDVLSVSPLKIKVDNRIEVTEEFIFLSFLCKRFVIDKEHKHYVPPHTEKPEPWDKTMQETEEIELWRAIKAGDKVKMIRLHGGQMYYVIERLEMEGTRE